MCYCDACGKKFRPPIVYDKQGNFKEFDFLCSKCKSLGRMVSTEEAIRRHDWHRVTVLDEVLYPVDNFISTNRIIDDFN